MRKIPYLEIKTIGNELSNNILLNDVGLKKIKDEFSRKIYDIINSPDMTNEKFLEIIVGLNIGDKISVNGIKGSVIGFKTKGNKKTGVVVGMGGNNKVTINSAGSAITNKMNILRKPLGMKGKNEKTWKKLEEIDTKGKLGEIKDMQSGEKFTKEI